MTSSLTEAARWSSHFCEALAALEYSRDRGLISKDALLTLRSIDAMETNFNWVRPPRETDEGKSLPQAFFYLFPPSKHSHQQIPVTRDIVRDGALRLQRVADLILKCQESALPARDIADQTAALAAQMYQRVKNTLAERTLSQHYWAVAGAPRNITRLCTNYDPTGTLSSLGAKVWVSSHICGAATVGVLWVIPNNHGNRLNIWCRDGYGEHGIPRPADVLNAIPTEAHAVVIGRMMPDTDRVASTNLIDRFEDFMTCDINALINDGHFRKFCEETLNCRQLTPSRLIGIGYGARRLLIDLGLYPRPELPLILIHPQPRFHHAKPELDDDIANGFDFDDEYSPQDWMITKATADKDPQALNVLILLPKEPEHQQLSREVGSLLSAAGSAVTTIQPSAPATNAKQILAQLQTPEAVQWLQLQQEPPELPEPDSNELQTPQIGVLENR